MNIEDESKRSLAHAFLSPWANFSGGLISTLKLTLKTHEDPGEVSFRQIHASSKSPMIAISKFIMFCLRPALATIPHLMINSEAVCKRLRDRHFPTDLTFVKIDVDDFFMTGEHSELIRLSCEAVDAHWRPLYRAALRLALSSQYITNDGDLFQVVVGAGMGVMYSGDLCDLVFYWGTERGLLDNNNILRKLGIVQYMRYKDDILILCDNDVVQRGRMLRAMRKRSGVWKLKLEQVSSNDVTFLDLHIQKSRHDRSKLEIGIHNKVSALKRPLGISSHHALRVHLAWPKGMATRANRLCSSTRLRQQEMERLTRFLGLQFGTSYAEAVLHHSVLANSNPLRHTWKSYLVLPYFRDLEICGNIRSILVEQSELLRDLDCEYDTEGSLALSFRNGGAHLHSILDKFRRSDTTHRLWIFT